MYEPVVKIGSFGFSKSAMMDSMAKTAVSAHHRMPEVLPASSPLALRAFSRTRLASLQTSDILLLAGDLINQILRARG